MGSMATPAGDLTPSGVTGATFKVVKRGYDQGEVRAYLARVAARIQQLQAEIETLEVRSRAALARLQAAEASNEPPLVDHAETISRTLLLAQRTADETMARAQRDADEMISSARDTARDEFTEAYNEAQSEVEALRARREFLAGDVDELERFLDLQRARLSEVAERLLGFVAAPIEGLGIGARPVLSNADVASRALGVGESPPTRTEDDTAELEFELAPIGSFDSPATASNDSDSDPVDRRDVANVDDDEPGNPDEGSDTWTPAASPDAGPTSEREAAVHAEVLDAQTGSRPVHQPVLDLEVSEASSGTDAAPVGRGLRFRDDP